MTANLTRHNKHRDEENFDARDESECKHHARPKNSKPAVRNMASYLSNLTTRVELKAASRLEQD
eukprot:5806804-Amphidinium_carterae.1